MKTKTLDTGRGKVLQQGSPVVIDGTKYRVASINNDIATVRTRLLPNLETEVNVNSLIHEPRVGLWRAAKEDRQPVCFDHHGFAVKVFQTSAGNWFAHIERDKECILETADFKDVRQAIQVAVTYCEQNKAEPKKRGLRPTQSPEKRGKREIVRAHQSPLNDQQWLCKLDCGHEQWVTSKRYPKQKIECELCR